MTTQLFLNVATITAITIGLVEAFKRTGYLKENFRALFAIAVAIVITFISTGFDKAGLFNNLIQGIITGLMSVGLFSTGKDTKESIDIVNQEPIG